MREAVAVHRWRHLIENLSAKPGKFRAIVTCDDETEGSFTASINLAAAIAASR